MEVIHREDPFLDLENDKLNSHYYKMSEVKMLKKKVILRPMWKQIKA